jgi:putative FmdB family regulatory protein
MPLYEFRCASCGHQFEELIFKTSEVEDLTCPTCGAKQVNQLMSAFSTASSRSSSGSSNSSCGPGSFS